MRCRVVESCVRGDCVRCPVPFNPSFALCLFQNLLLIAHNGVLKMGEAAGGRVGDCGGGGVLFWLRDDLWTYRSSTMAKGAKLTGESLFGILLMVRSELSDIEHLWRVVFSESICSSLMAHFL